MKSLNRPAWSRLTLPFIILLILVLRLPVLGGEPEPFNTIVGQPPVRVLLPALGSQPLNTIVGKPPVRVLLPAYGNEPLNTVVGQPPMRVTFPDAPPPLVIAPLSTNVAPGQMVTFNPSGGLVPYEFTLAANNSGGSIASNIYTAGVTNGVMDTVRLTSAGTSVLATVTVVEPAGCPPPLSGLVAWWRGENNALDNVGSHHGVPVNGAGFAPGRVGQAFSLTGPDDYMDLGTAADLNFQNTSFTLSTWVYLTMPHDDYSRDGILSRYSVSGGSWWLGRLSEGYLALWLDSDGGWPPEQGVSSPAVFPTNEWHHIAAVYDHSTGALRLYIDGQLAGSASGAPISVASTPGTKVTIGAWWSYDGVPANGTDAAQGFIDEVALFNRALSAAEIQAYVNCIAPPPLQLAPSSTNVTAGATVTFTATGGTPPYRFDLTAQPSGGNIASNGVSTALYTAGNAPGTDIVRVRDTNDTAVTATVTVSLPPAPEIAVLQPAGVNLTDASSTVNWGVVAFGASSNKTFIITNTGTANLTGLTVTLDGADAARFSASPLGATTLAPGASTTFTVTYSPAGGSLFNAALHIASNDEDENPFDLNLTGTVPPRDANRAYEPFLIGANPAAGEYVAGNLAGQNPAVPGWAGLWQSAFGGPPVASASGLTYAGLAGSGGSVSLADSRRTGRLLAQPYGHGFSGVVYLRFLLRMNSSVPSAYRAFELHDGGFDDSAHRVLHLGQSVAANFDFRLFQNEAMRGSLGAAGAGPDLFVIKFTFSTAPNGDGVTVWRNPDPALLGLADPPDGVTFSGFDMHFDRTSICHTLGGADFDFDEMAFFDGPPQIVPAAPTVFVGTTLNFSMVGGTPPRTFSFVENNSSGSLTAEGAYMAGPSPATDSIRVTDNYGRSAINLVTVLASAPEIAVEQPAGTGLVDGTGTIDFGSALVSTPGTTRVFTIRSTGIASLTGLAVTAGGANAGDFTLNTNGLAASLAPGTSTTFTVTFNPAAPGARTATLHIASNDADENPFDIALAGTGYLPLQISPASTNVAAGATVTFTASGGTPPYRFDLTALPSGGTIVSNGVSTALYTAGNTAGTDTVRVRDTNDTAVTATVTVSLPPFLIVSGRVTDAVSGNPLPGITITLTSPGGMTNTVTNTVTDFDGRYEFPGAATGQPHTLTPAINGFTFAPASSTFTLGLGNRVHDFSAAQERFIISGTVAETSGTPIGFAELAIIGTSTETAKTDGSGFYSSSLLAGGGSYTLAVSRSGYTFSAPQTVANLASDTTADFTGTALPRRISGVVTNPAGGGVAGVVVVVSLVRPASGFSTNVTTDSQGRYAVTNLRPEIDYTVAPAIDGSTSFTPNLRTVSLQLGDAVANFRAVRSYTISGRIWDGSANVADVRVLVTDLAIGPLTPSKQSLGNSNPNYTTQPLPEGATYLVTPSLAGYAFTPPSITVSTLAANVTGADFLGSLIGSRGSILGTVTNALGVGLAGVGVIMSGGASQSQNTSANGSFNFPKLQGGQDYRLTFSRLNFTFTPPFIDLPSLLGTTRASVRATPALPLAGRIASIIPSSAAVPVLMMNADSSALRVAATLGRPPAEDAKNRTVALSPDGRRLAFVSAVPPNAQLFVMNADGSGLRQVTTTSGLNAHNPAWSPDGNQIAYVDLRSSGSWGVYVINASGSGRFQVMGDSSFPYGTPQGVAWSPDGQRLAVGLNLGRYAYDHNFTIATIRTDGGDRVFIANGWVTDSVGLAWAPAGRIAFNRHAATGGPNQIFTMRADGFDRRQVTSLTTGHAYSPTWSPDGTLLAYSHWVGNNQQQVIAIGADGSLPTPLAQGAAPSWSRSPAGDTPAGQSITAVDGGAAVTFSDVTVAGTTTIISVPAPNQGALPAGFFSLPGASLNYEVTTTASYAGPLTVCFTVPISINAGMFNKLRILHAENGVLMDRTITTGPGAPNFTTRTICAQVTSLSPFYVSQLAEPAPALISGAVIDADGSPIEGILLSANDPDVPDAVTDADGSFAFPNLTPGQSYLITPLDANSDFTPAAALLSPVAGENTLVFVSTPRSGPPLTITPDLLTPGRYNVTWEAAADAYALESTASLSAPGWATAPEPASSVGDVNTVSIEAANATRYLRLRKQ